MPDLYALTGTGPPASTCGRAGSNHLPRPDHATATAQPADVAAAADAAGVALCLPRPYDVVVTSSHACVKGFCPAREPCTSATATPRCATCGSSHDVAAPCTGTAVGARALAAPGPGSTRWVDDFAAISTAVQARIEKLYGRPTGSSPRPSTPGHFDPPSAPRRAVSARRLPDDPVQADRPGHPGLPMPASPSSSPATGPERPSSARSAQRWACRHLRAPPDDERSATCTEARRSCSPPWRTSASSPSRPRRAAPPSSASAEGASLDTIIPGVTGALAEPSLTRELPCGRHRVGYDSPGFDGDELAGARPSVSPGPFPTRFLDWVIGSAAERQGCTCWTGPCAVIQPDAWCHPRRRSSLDCRWLGIGGPGRTTEFDAPWHRRVPARRPWVLWGHRRRRGCTRPGRRPQRSAIACRSAPGPRAAPCARCPRGATWCSSCISNGRCRRSPSVTVMYDTIALRTDGSALVRGQ